VGRAALTILADRLRAEGHRTLMTSWVDAPGGPAPFYRRLGFVPTGEIDDGEVVARLAL
jgi:diamine N-acetyltransferase